MKISEHANYLLNEYGRLQFDYAAYYKPYGESLRNEARNNLEEYIAGLEKKVDSAVKEDEISEESKSVYVSYIELVRISLDAAQRIGSEIELHHGGLIKLFKEIDALQVRIAELEAAQARWVMASERLPKVSGWYLTGLVHFLGSPYSNEVYFDAENIEPRWNNITSDKIYCWLDSVPELPQPPKVQE